VSTFGPLSGASQRDKRDGGVRVLTVGADDERVDQPQITKRRYRAVSVDSLLGRSSFLLICPPDRATLPERIDLPKVSGAHGEQRRQSEFSAATNVPFQIGQLF